MFPRPRRAGRGPAARVDDLTESLGEAALAVWVHPR
jgi:hypothetical protein